MWKRRKYISFQVISLSVTDLLLLLLSATCEFIRTSKRQLEGEIGEAEDIIPEWFHSIQFFHWFHFWVTFQEDYLGSWRHERKVERLCLQLLWNFKNSFSLWLNAPQYCLQHSGALGLIFNRFPNSLNWVIGEFSRKICSWRLMLNTETRNVQRLA